MPKSEVLGNAVIPVRAVLDKLDGDLDDARRKVEASTATMSSKMGKLGGQLTRTLTPAGAGIALASKQAFSEWDAGIDTIRAKTGATGDELDALGDSLKAVGGKSTQGLGVVGEMMADVAARTGLTGKPLETLTTRLLELDRIGNAMSAESATRLFGDWGIAAEDGADSLDRLFRSSQNTGVPMERLSDLMVQFGAPMRELGFAFDESAALLGKFEQEGVNTESVLAGLKISVAKFAKEGKTPAQGLADVVARLKELGPGAEATSLAMETFGQRAGIDVAKAVEEGRFNIDELLSTVKGGEDTIAQAAADTLDWGDKLAMLKNRAVAVIGPFGEVGMAVGGIAAAVGPTVSGLGKMGPGLSKVGGKVVGLGKSAGSAVGKLASMGASGAKAFGSLSASAVKSTAMVGAQVARQVAAWAVLGVQSLAHAAKVALAWAISMGPILIVGAAVVGLVALIVKNWDTIKAVTAALWDGIKRGVSAAWDWITDKVGMALDFVKSLFLNFTGPGLLLKHWDTIKAGAGAAFDWITGKIQGFIGFFMGIPGTISGIARGMWDGLTSSFRGALNFLIDAWNRLDFGIDISVPGWVPGVGGKGFKVKDVIPDIPRLAMGGTVTGGGFAEVGEWGRELAFLPTGAEVMSNRSSSGVLEAMAAAGGSSSPEVIKLYVDGRELFEVVRDRFDNSDTRNGRGRRVSVR